MALWFWRRFLKGFTIYGRGGHLGHVTQTPRTNFRSPIPLRFHMEFGFEWPGGFGEEDLWKWWTKDGRGRMDDGPWLYYKLTNEPKGSGELKTFTLSSPKIPILFDSTFTSLYSEMSIPSGISIGQQPSSTGKMSEMSVQSLRKIWKKLPFIFFKKIHFCIAKYSKEKNNKKREAEIWARSLLIL